MSNLSDMKERLKRMSGLMAKVRGNLSKLGGPEGQELRQQLKQEGKKIGISAGVTIFGAGTILVASMYIIYVLILLLDLALNRLWLSAMLVVLGSFIFGGLLALVGINRIRSSVKRLPATGDGTLLEIKQASEELKKTIEELREIAKREKEERARQLKEAMQGAKTVVPLLAGAYVGYRVLKRLVGPSKAKTKRFVLEEWEED